MGSKCKERPIIDTLLLAEKPNVETWNSVISGLVGGSQIPKYDQLYNALMFKNRYLYI